MNRKTELFLDTYRQLEAIASARFDLRESESAVSFLERRGEYREIKSELAYCREVRNLLSHNPKVQDRFAVEPSDGMIELLKRVIAQVKNPQKAKHIWVPRQSVVCRTMEDYVRPAMAEMCDRVFTHIPIVDKGVVVGAFSENTLLNYLLDDGAVTMDSGIRFSDIRKYLPLEQHRAESFRFVGQETPASEIVDIFGEADRNSDRIGLIFVTQNGRQSEKLLGIISPWDVAGIGCGNRP